MSGSGAAISGASSSCRHGRPMAPWERRKRDDATRGVVVAEAHLPNFGELLVREFLIIEVLGGVDGVLEDWLNGP